MVRELEDLISKLYECLLTPQNGDLPRSIVSDIVYLCSENLNSQAICRLFFKPLKNTKT